MNQCVVIKLKESSTAENLTRLGALKLKVKAKKSTVIGLEFFSGKTQTIRVNGYGAHFTDVSGSVDLSQEITINPSGTISAYISIIEDVETEIEFSDKYAITRLSTSDGGDFIWDQGGSGVEIGIDIDFADFKYCTSLNGIYLSKGRGTGNLENFKKLPIRNILLFSNNNKMIVEGNIVDILVQSTLFENIVITDQSLVTGDFSAFSHKLVTDSFELSGTSVTGLIDDLTGVSATNLILQRMKKYIGGNIAALNDNVKFFSVAQSSNAVFEYNNFNSSRTDFLAIEGGYIRSGINKLIIDSAAIVALNPPSTTDPKKRAINVTANDFDKNAPGMGSTTVTTGALDKLRLNGIDVIINGIVVNP